MTTLTDIERISLEHVRRAVPLTASAETFLLDEWITFGLQTMFEVGAKVRDLRIQPLKELVRLKEDGSPVIVQEAAIEAFVKERLLQFQPQAKFMGEESGGEFPEQGITLAIDPIDGTWQLVNRTEACAVSIVFLRNRVPFLGMVLNPATGELAYTATGKKTRLIQPSLFGEGDRGRYLPFDQVHRDTVLVNVHPNRRVNALLTALYTAWQKDGIRMVRSPGGSPSLALMEAAKGNFIYVNMWAKRAAQPYDLAAGAFILRRAGGEIVDSTGKPIEDLIHTGPFIAGVNQKALSQITEIVYEVIDQASRELA